MVELLESFESPAIKDVFVLLTDMAPEKKKPFMNKLSRFTVVCSRYQSQRKARDTNFSCFRIYYSRAYKIAKRSSAGASSVAEVSAGVVICYSTLAIETCKWTRNYCIQTQ